LVEAIRHFWNIIIIFEWSAPVAFKKLMLKYDFSYQFWWNFIFSKWVEIGGFSFRFLVEVGSWWNEVECETLDFIVIWWFRRDWSKLQPGQEIQLKTPINLVKDQNHHQQLQ
jgi:hypothetical protein